jgi:uncharacterized protein (DUF2236 family)
VPLSGLGLLAGAANVVMQLGLPPVGRGVVESTVRSGQLFAHPAKRTRTTLTYLAVALLGDDEDRRRYRSAVDRQHARVRSAPGAPVAYDAMDPDLQLWVAACLYVGLEDVARWSGRLGPETYHHAAVLGTTLQVRAEQWPPDRDAFGRYWESMLPAVRYDPEVRDHLEAVARMAFLPRPVAALLGPANHWLTIGFVHEPFRTRMGWSWTSSDQRRFERLLSALFAVERRLPAAVRTFPFNVLLRDLRRRVARKAPIV